MLLLLSDCQKSIADFAPRTARTHEIEKSDDMRVTFFTSHLKSAPTGCALEMHPRKNACIFPKTRQAAEVTLRLSV